MVLYNTILAMGAVLQPTNIRLHSQKLKYIIEHSGTRAIFIDADLLPSLSAVPPSAFAAVERIVVCDENMRSGGWTLSVPFLKVKTADFKVRCSRRAGDGMHNVRI